MIYLQTISALALVLGLIALLYWGGQRLGGRIQKNSGARIQVRERMALGEKRWLLIIRADGRELLVGTTPSSFTLISELEPSNDSSNPDIGEGSAQPSFKKLLENLR